jgi:hypothetical protein
MLDGGVRARTPTLARVARPGGHHHPEEQAADGAVVGAHEKVKRR